MVHVSLHSSDEIEYLNVMPPGAQAAAHTMHVHEECVSEYTFSRPTHTHTHTHTRAHTPYASDFTSLFACNGVSGSESQCSNLLDRISARLPSCWLGESCRVELYRTKARGKARFKKKKKKDTSF